MISAFFSKGCAYSEKEADAESIFLVARDSRFLPTGGGYQQFEPIGQGTQVELLRRGWGFSMVKLRNGKTGEIPREDLLADSRGWSTARQGFESQANGLSASIVEEETEQDGSFQTGKTEEEGWEGWGGGFESVREDLTGLDSVEPELPSWP